MSMTRLHLEAIRRERQVLQKRLEELQLKEAILLNWIKEDEQLPQDAASRGDKE
jgi:hypothetical protein